MHKKLIAVAVAGALATPLAAVAQVSYNVGVVSDYLFRGVSQTHGAPAVSAGIDYAHPSGFYIGAWGSNITWVKDWLGKGSVEVDVYGGYKGSLGGDWGYDVGYITYNYPGHGNAQAWLANPNTQELYLGLSYKWLSAKYSYATSDYFIGWMGGAGYNQKTRGSDYLELNANYDLGDGLTLVGHVGQQKVKGYIDAPGLRSADYTDWKIGLTKDVGFGIVGVAYSTTDAEGTCTAAGGTSSYCWGDNGSQTGGPTAGFRDVAKGTLVLSFTKSF